MKNLFFLSLMLFLISCGSNTDTEGDITNDTVTTDSSDDSATVDNPSDDDEATTASDMADLYGYYVGMFEAEVYDNSKKPTWSNKINISIDKIDGESIEGHSVVAGNDRPFSGTIKAIDESNYEVEATEPGDDKYDGAFSFTITKTTDKVVGNWKANDKNLAVTQRSYKLEKRAFKYDPEASLEGWGYTDLYDSYDQETDESEFLTEQVGMFNPSTDELTKGNVENMKKGDLEVMRNSIYARHGYSFKNRKMRYVFNYVDWYIPVHTDIRSELTDLEKKNIELIKRYEKHAERYYDSFGR